MARWTDRRTDQQAYEMMEGQTDSDINYMTDRGRIDVADGRQMHRRVDKTPTYELRRQTDRRTDSLRISQADTDTEGKIRQRGRQTVGQTADIHTKGKARQTDR